MSTRGQYRVAGPTPIAPRYAPLRRAVRAVFDLYNHERAPYYVYAEVNGIVDVAPAQMDADAYARAADILRSPGEVYVAVFDVASGNWPSPVHQRYHAALQEPLAVAGTRGSNARGQYGRAAVGDVYLHGPRGLVGRLYHSVSDRADAVKQLDLDWTAFYQDVANQVGELTPDPSSTSGYRYTTQAELDALHIDPNLTVWWKSFIKPRHIEWVKFRRDQLGTDRTVAADYIAFAERFQTNWSVYEEWLGKLEELKATAKRVGFKDKVPKVQALPTSVFEDVGCALKRAGQKAGDAAGDVWKFTKYGLIAVLGIGAVVAVSSVAMNLKKGRDPVEHYADLYRRRRAHDS